MASISMRHPEAVWAISALPLASGMQLGRAEAELGAAVVVALVDEREAAGGEERPRRPPR